ncbi:hypothetical protein ACSBQT_01950 [Brevibacterium sp. H602]|uniref:hypothetical protein n=1 Tax=Brevibacterium sp. H602 TaxID=3444316 RepID=UPI003EB770D0
MTKLTMSQLLDELPAESRLLLETSQKAAVVYAADRVAEILEENRNLTGAQVLDRLDEDVEAVIQGTVLERIE